MARVSNISRHSESGMTLLETLLVVGVTSIMLMGIMEIAGDWSQRLANRQESDYLMRTHTGAEAYVQTNFANLWINGFSETFGDTDSNGVRDNSDITSEGRVIMIPFDDTGTSPFYLRDETAVFTPDFPATTPSRRDVVVYVRNMGYVGGRATLEVLTATTLDSITGRQRNLPLIHLMDIAQAIGPQAGLYTTDSDCDSALMRSSYGSWEVRGSDLAAGNMVSGPAYCPEVDPDQGVAGHIVLQSRLVYQDSYFEDYLYRVSIPGAPELNRMEANLDMNENTLLNAGNMSADNVRVTAGMRVLGAQNGTGVFVEETLRVEGTGNTVYAKAESSTNDPNCVFVDDGAGGRMLSAGATACDVFGGDIYVSGTPGANALVGESLVLRSLSADAADLSANTITVNQNLDIGGNAQIRGNAAIGDSLLAGRVSTREVDVSSEVNTTRLQAAALEGGVVPTLQSGAMVAGRMTVNDAITASSLRVTGSIGAEQGLTVEGDMGADQFSVESSLTGCTATVVHRFPYQGNFETVSPYNCTEAPESGHE